MDGIGRIDSTILKSLQFCLQYISAAIGEFAKSSARVETSTLSSQLSQRTRKRGIPIKDDDSSERSSKRQQTVNTDTYDIITSVLKDHRAKKRNNIELAIELLETEYEDRLSIPDFVQALEVLADYSKASVFISVKSVERRDTWFKKAIGVQLI
jgi:ribosome-binding factor A